MEASVLQHVHSDRAPSLNPAGEETKTMETSNRHQREEDAVDQLGSARYQSEAIQDQSEAAQDHSETAQNQSESANGYGSDPATKQSSVTMAALRGGGEKGGVSSLCLQCSQCKQTWSSHAHLLTHTAAAHPIRLDHMVVGRLGNILAYQKTAELFHCSDCFFTCKDFSKLYVHLLTDHCSEPGEGERENQEEEEEASRSRLLHLEGSTYHCVCGWKNRVNSKAVAHLIKKHHFPKANALHTLEQLGKRPPGTPAMGHAHSSVHLHHTSGHKSSLALLQEEKAILSKFLNFRTNRFVCLICSWSCKMKGFAVKHLISAHQVACPYTCQVCSLSFFLPSLLQNHVDLQHRPGRYSCPYCNFRSHCLTGFKRHLYHCSAQQEGGWGKEEEEQGCREKEEEGGGEMEEDEQGGGEEVVGVDRRRRSRRMKGWGWRTGEAEGSGEAKGGAEEC